MADTPLPRPESERLAALVGGGSLRLAYGLLYRRQDHPPTEDELTLFLQMASADAPVDKVLRCLREYFEITTELFSMAKSATNCGDGLALGR
jgi:hypothetical protein